MLLILKRQRKLPKSTKYLLYKNSDLAKRWKCGDRSNAGILGIFPKYLINERKSMEWNGVLTDLSVETSSRTVKSMTRSLDKP